METKIDIKEENPLLDDVALQRERDFCTRKHTIKSNSLVEDSDMAIKTEIKSDPDSPDVCVQKETGCVTKQLSNHTLTEREITLQKERNILPLDSIMKFEQYNKVEIKGEPCWLETKSSSLYDGIKAENFTPVKLTRLCSEEISGDNSGGSLLISAETAKKTINCNYGMDYPEFENQEINVTKLSQSVENNASAEQSGNYSAGGEIYSKALLAHKSFDQMNSLNIHESESFTDLSGLKKCNLNHKGKQLHKCEICDKKFTRFSHLKLHNLIHEGKKPYKCEICEKNFTLLSYLKAHNLIHEGKRSQKCQTCGKTFIHLRDLKRHNLIHEGKKPHSCEVCDKKFTRLSHLKRHNLIHEGKRPYKCEICDRKFTRLAHLKRHNFIHEGEKPHKCEICEKSFTQISYLKLHVLIHEGKKPYKCDICEQSFTQFANLKRHSLMHKAKKPHICKICEKGFTRLSSLKSHNLLHEG